MSPSPSPRAGLHCSLDEESQIRPRGVRATYMGWNFGRRLITIPPTSSIYISHVNTWPRRDQHSGTCHDPKIANSQANAARMKRTESWVDLRLVYKTHQMFRSILYIHSLRLPNKPCRENRPHVEAPTWTLIVVTLAK